MVEQNAVARVHAIRLAVVHRDPVGVHLGHRVGAARVEGRGFLLRNFLHQAIELGGGGLVKLGLLLQPQNPNRLQNAQGANRVHICRVLGRLKRHRHVAHGAQVVNLVWLRFLDDANQVAGVAQVAVVQLEACVVHVRVLVDVVHALRVEERGPALDAVHRVALLQQKLSQVRSVLPGDAGDQCNFVGMTHGGGAALALVWCVGW